MFKKYSWVPVIILIIFFAVGLFMIKDYGASADEHIQIDSGHVIWKYLCRKFGREVPAALADTPDLHGFKNSYYGQAATFPTVLLEAICGFSLDSSTIIKIRHYWNFFCYYIGLSCFSAMILHMTRDGRLSGLWLLFQIMLPRIFGDIFYNDRDVMLISWMMIFIASFYLFLIRPGWFSSLFSAVAFGLAFNTRIFALALLIFPCLCFLCSPDKRKYLLFFVLAAFVVWFLLSPIAWDAPMHTIPETFKHFSKQQRYLDTNNKATALFFGKEFNETKLPWYYIPLYIIVTTPMVTLAFAMIGSFSGIMRGLRKREKKRALLDLGMLTILLTVPMIGILFHLTFYNGWRHFYFLLLPITWLGLEGFCLIWHLGKRLLQIAAVAALCFSFFLSASWIFFVHPYQSIYLSPVFRNHWIGQFNRDYWLLSTTECMKYLIENASDTVLNVVDKKAFIEYTVIGLPPQDRDRFHTMHHSSQPIPYEYLFYNYSGVTSNEMQYDYYVPIYAVERDGIKLAEIFQRSHNDEISASEIIDTIFSTINQKQASLMADDDYRTAWYGNAPGEIILRFNGAYELWSLEIFPADGSAGFQNVKASISSDGVLWTTLETKAKGSNGIGFSPIVTEWLKLESNTENSGIREILFYGIKNMDKS